MSLWQSVSSNFDENAGNNVPDHEDVDLVEPARTKDVARRQHDAKSDEVDRRLI